MRSFNLTLFSQSPFALGRHINMLRVRHFLLLVFTVCIQTSLSYHVLFYHNWGTKSHLIQFAPVVEELLGRGHEVTAVIFNSIKMKNENSYYKIIGCLMFYVVTF